MNEIKIENNQLKIKLIEIKHITDMSYMFYNCISLISFPNFNKWNLKNLKRLSFMFSGCNDPPEFYDSWIDNH